MTKQKKLQTRKNTEHAVIFATVVTAILIMRDAPWLLDIIACLVTFAVIKLVLDIGIAIEKTIKRAVNRED